MHNANIENIGTVQHTIKCTTYVLKSAGVEAYLQAVLNIVKFETLNTTVCVMFAYVVIK